MFQRSTAILVIVALAGLASSAAAQHMHCEIRPWGPIELTPTPSTPFPIVFTGTPMSLSFPSIMIPLPEPGPSSMPECTYELSDITLIRITLQLLPDSQVQFTSLSATTQLPAASPQNPGPYLFTTQTATKVFTFPPHQTGSPLNPSLTLTFPAPLLSLTLMGGTNAAGGATMTSTVIGATVQISGNHYFVPEPGSAMLLLCGGVLALRRRRV